MFWSGEWGEGRGLALVSTLECCWSQPCEVGGLGPPSFGIPRAGRAIVNLQVLTWAFGGVRPSPTAPVHSTPLIHCPPRPPTVPSPPLHCSLSQLPPCPHPTAASTRFASPPPPHSDAKRALPTAHFAHPRALFAPPFYARRTWHSLAIVHVTPTLALTGRSTCGTGANIGSANDAHSALADPTSVPPSVLQACSGACFSARGPQSA